MLDEQTPAEADQGSTDQNSTDQSSTSGSGATEVTGQPAAEAAAESPPAPRKRAPRKTAAKKTAAAGSGDATEGDAGTDTDGSGEPKPVKKTTRKRTTKKAAAAEPSEAAGDAASTQEATPEAGDQASEDGAARPAKRAAAKRTPAKRTSRARKTDTSEEAPAGEGATTDAAADTDTDTDGPAASSAAVPLFQAPPETPAKPAKKTTRKSTAKRTTKKAASAEETVEPSTAPASSAESAETGEATSEESAPTVPSDAPDHGTTPDAGDEAAATGDQDSTDDSDNDGEQDGSAEQGEGQPRRRRRRGGRRRRRGGSGGGSGSSGDDSGDSDAEGDSGDGDESADTDSGKEGQDEASGSGESGSGESGEGGGSSSSRRRRRRRRSSDSDTDSGDDPENTVTRVRKGRSAEDEIASFTGSTRLEAKKQRRREGREAGRRRAPLISEAEFLARRESVDRKMVIRQRADLTQIAVLEDKVLVEHYVARESQTSLIGNVYLGRVQNVLPSMEAAFIDIGKGRNAVLYAGEVNWDALGAKDGSQRKIEQVLKSGQSVLVQVTKDPIGHKGARLTSQISLPGRFLVYVPDGTTSGISRKLPDKERTRLKTLLKEIVPDDAGVIVRTAAEGADEKELVRDVERLKALWTDISAKVEKGNAPQLLYGEPDLTLKVVRDLFTEDIGKLVVSGEEAWEMVDSYVRHIAPDLVDRLEKHDDSDGDAFAAYRIDEQIAKALDRKVWLPSGGSLVIDRTEAMTVVDVNTGKFTGSGGNLEETVTKNNLEAAEEIVRQLRLRDIGGIIVVDFIDMVLESNRDLVLRRLVECLGRDRTRHQVAEVTSLGLVQMTRKRIGTGLLEAFSESCDQCQGRGLITHQEPVEPKKRQQNDDEPRRGRRGRGRGRSEDKSDNGSDSAKQDGSAQQGTGDGPKRPTPAEFAAMARAEASPTESTPPEGQPEEKPEAESKPEAEAEPKPEAVTEPEPQPQPEPEPSTEPRAESEPQAESEPEAPAEPAAPRIVTSVRRIGARRAAGPPQTAGPAGGPADDGSSSPEPTVSDDAAEAPGADPERDEAAVHVPVKKKGSRKR